MSTTDVVSTQTSVLHTERRQSEFAYRLELEIAIVFFTDDGDDDDDFLQAQLARN